MLLTIDIGNTQVVAGLWKDEELVLHWRLSSTIERTEDETWVLMHAICRTRGFDLEETTGVIMSSVVPNRTFILEKMAEKYLSCPYTLVNSDLDLGIRIDYHSPSDVGSDRLCNAVAGYTLYKSPLLIVDFGTATSFDVISGEGHYLGGVIAPGIEMSSQLLHQRAARLPSISLEFTEKIIGNTTVRSMQSGLMWGTVEMINGITCRIERELDQVTTKIATGGLAPVVVNELDADFKLESHLTLQGLYFIHKRIHQR